MVCGMSIRMLVWECALNCVQRTIQYQEKTRYFRIDFCSDRFQLSCSIEFLLMAMFLYRTIMQFRVLSVVFLPKKMVTLSGKSLRLKCLVEEEDHQQLLTRMRA
jgi:hypothetical protein